MSDTRFGVVVVAETGDRKVIAVCSSPGWADIIRDCLRMHGIKEVRYEATVLPASRATRKDGE